MRNILFTLFLVVFAAGFLRARTPTPHYGVIDEAESEISDLENLNREMAGLNIGLEEENRLLEGDIARSREFIVQADTLIDRLGVSAGEIRILMQSISDPATRGELQQRMEDNRRSLYDLENRKRRKNESISSSEERIENNRKMIAVNRVRTKANDQRVEYLRARIDLSTAGNRDVDSVLDNADRVRREVARLLRQ